CSAGTDLADSWTRVTEAPVMSTLINPPEGTWDELLLPDGTARPHGRDLIDWLRKTSATRFERKRAEADLLFRRSGITFSVYGDAEGSERLIPFDVVPRVIPAAEWQT